MTIIGRKNRSFSVPAHLEVAFYDHVKAAVNFTPSFLFSHDNRTHWGWGEYLGVKVKEGIGWLYSRDGQLIHGLYDSLPGQKNQIYHDRGERWVGKMNISDPFLWLNAIAAYLDRFIRPLPTLVGFVGSSAYRYKVAGLPEDKEIPNVPEIYFHVPLIALTYFRQTDKSEFVNRSELRNQKSKLFLRPFVKRKERRGTGKLLIPAMKSTATIWR